MRRSAEMPFSRSSTWTASIISLDIRSSLQQVAAVDLGVGDRDDPRVGRDRHLVVRGADELACEASAAAVVLVRGYLNARAASKELPKVIGLGQRALRARRRHLEASLLKQVAQVSRDALAGGERD